MANTNAFTIPTIYTAIDKHSAVVKAMQNNVSAFAAKTEVALSNSNKWFNKLTPAIGGAAKQFLSFASAAAISSGIIAGGAFSVKSIMDYETELANLQAVTGASGKDFDIFKGKIQEVAAATQKSSVEVAQAFTAIANNQPALLKDANALAMVTQSSILLAHASKMELQPAGEALTQILNQFGKGAADAAKTVDILAAGSVAGSSEIRDTAAAIQQFGTVAANSGVKINESVALIELASKFEKGAEAGTRLRNILITMSAIKVQDPKALKDLHRLGVNLDVVSNSALPLNTRLLEMSKISKDNAALFHVFGKENQALAAGVLSTAGNFNGMMDAVNTQGMASTMAAKNNDTLAIALQQLKARWVNMITGAEGATKALDTAKNVTRFLIKHLDTIVSIGTKVIIFFAAWKALMIASRIAMIAYNIAFGINNALQKRSLFFTEGNIVAKNADLIATKAITAAQWLWNAAMSANPIGLVIIAIAALSYLIYEQIDNWEEWGSAITLTQGPLGTVISLCKELYDGWDAITSAFTDEGIMAGLKKLGSILFDAILKPMQKVLELIADFTGFEWAQSAVDSMKSFRADMGIDVTGTGASEDVPIIHSRAAEREAALKNSHSSESQNVNINIKDKTGRASVESDNDIVPIKLSSTQTWNGSEGRW